MLPTIGYPTIRGPGCDKQDSAFADSARLPPGEAYRVNIQGPGGTVTPGPAWRLINGTLHYRADGEKRTIDSELLK